METVYYNFYAFEGAKASGGEEPRALLVREAVPRRYAADEAKVISLDDYRARQAARAAAQTDADSWGETEATEYPELEQPAPRPRSHRRDRMLAGLELAACGAIIVLAAVVCAAFLL